MLTFVNKICDHTDLVWCLIISTVDNENIVLVKHSWLLKGENKINKELKKTPPT